MKEGNQDLQAAIDKFPIVMWLQQHFRIKDTGADRVRIDCPVCRGERTLSVTLSSKFFHCFRCDDGGLGASVWNGRASLFTFLKLYEKLSPRQTFTRIRTLAGLPDVAREQMPVSFERWPKEAVPLSSAVASHPSVKWLVGRGMGHLIPVSKVCPTGTYANRILLPCNFLGTTTGFEAKTYVGATPKSKLHYFPEEHGHLYTTWNWDSAQDFAVVTESIIDAETLGVNAVGIFGSVLRDEQLLALLRLKEEKSVKRLVWFLDGDAWRKQANSIARKTSLFFDNYVVLTPQSQDPNSLGYAKCWEMVGKATSVVDTVDMLSPAQ